MFTCPGAYGYESPASQGSWVSEAITRAWSEPPWVESPVQGPFRRGGSAPTAQRPTGPKCDVHYRWSVVFRGKGCVATSGVAAANCLSARVPPAARRGSAQGQAPRAVGMPAADGRRRRPARPRTASTAEEESRATAAAGTQGPRRWTCVLKSPPENDGEARRSPR